MGSVFVTIMCSRRSLAQDERSSTIELKAATVTFYVLFQLFEAWVLFQVRTLYTHRQRVVGQSDEPPGEMTDEGNVFRASVRQSPWLRGDSGQVLGLIDEVDQGGVFHKLDVVRH